jgi:tetratricopeptide (TPR) repeat protein
MCFHLAMLELRMDQASDKAVAALERALEVKPDYTDARLQLGFMRLNALDYAAALVALSQIHQIDGEHAAALFNALAYAYSQIGKPDEVRKQAETALKWDRTDADKRQTENILRYLSSGLEPDKRPPAVRSTFSLVGERPTLVRQEEPETTPTPAPVTSPAPASTPARALNPIARQAETLDRVEGTARSVDCAGKRLLVDVGGKILAFDMSQPDMVSLRHNGQGVFKFTCGPQKPFHVLVEFAPPQKSRSDVKGTLRGLEF